MALSAGDAGRAILAHKFRELKLRGDHISRVRCRLAAPRIPGNLAKTEARKVSMGGVLEGVRVLDFGRYIAGPYCATLLAEFGAEVIRVEKRDGSEDRFVAPVGEGGEGALFLQINRNKKCVTLDPMKPEGQEVMQRLVKTADVVVANLPPQTLKAMKLDYESLKAVKSDIILTTATIPHA